MVPEADGDDSRHCELWRGSRGEQGTAGASRRQRGREQVPAKFCVVCAAIPARYGDARLLACRNRQRYLVQVAFASALTSIALLGVANC